MGRPVYRARRVAGLAPIPRHPLGTRQAAPGLCPEALDRLGAVLFEIEGSRCGAAQLHQIRSFVPPSQKGRISGFNLLSVLLRRCSGRIESQNPKFESTKVTSSPEASTSPATLAPSPTAQPVTYRTAYGASIPSGFADLLDTQYERGRVTTMYFPNSVHQSRRSTYRLMKPASRGSVGRRGDPPMIRPEAAGWVGRRFYPQVRRGLSNDTTSCPLPAYAM